MHYKILNYICCFHHISVKQCCSTWDGVLAQDQNSACFRSVSVAVAHPLPHIQTTALCMGLNLKAPHYPTPLFCKFRCSQRFSVTSILFSTTTYYILFLLLFLRQGLILQPRLAWNYVVQADLKHNILLCPLPGCWDYGHVLTHLPDSSTFFHSAIPNSYQQLWCQITFHINLQWISVLARQLKLDSVDHCPILGLNFAHFSGQIRISMRSWQMMVHGPKSSLLSVL